jgi:hypothetical protein
VFPEGVSDQVDYEGELGVVIGRRGVGISKEEAFDYVFGYTIINDVTARDVQKRHQQWYLGKSFDTFCPMAGGGQLYVPIRRDVSRIYRSRGELYSISGEESRRPLFLTACHPSVLGFRI